MTTLAKLAVIATCGAATHLAGTIPSVAAAAALAVVLGIALVVRTVR